MWYLHLLFNENIAKLHYTIQKMRRLYKKLKLKHLLSILKRRIFSIKMTHHFCKILFNKEITAF